MADMGQLTDREIILFFRYVSIGDGCWEWTGGKDRDGYGHFQLRRVRRSPLMAHRVAYEILGGEIPEYMAVLHRCDNPSCVRPDHLFLGTIADNVRDMDDKKRRAVGEKAGTAKWSDETIRTIRAALAERPEGRSDAAIARHFGVSASHLNRIKRHLVRKDCHV